MNHWKHSPSWTEGHKVEDIFAKLLAERDPNYKRATKQEQFRHIDFHTSFGTIDVKAKKKLNRRDNRGQDEYVWLEFKNVQGKTGWLCGETDIIAFERDNDFVLVQRSILFEMAKEKCDLNKRVLYSRDALYKGYSRKGRNDLISIVKMSDITQLPHRTWDK